MGKSEKRRKQQAEKARRKAEMFRPGGNSKYAQKVKRRKAGAANPRSPFKEATT